MTKLYLFKIEYKNYEFLGSSQVLLSFLRYPTTWDAKLLRGTLRGEH